MATPAPTLWHVRISHYSEKVRWALAHKGVEHERRAPPPGVHMAVALWLTRGRHKTFPVLELDGERIGDSTAIIAALEERFRDPPLYPAAAEERNRALALEDWFDEQLGPHIRRLGWHEARTDREALAKAVARDIPAPVRRWRPARLAAASYATAFTGLRYGTRSDAAAEDARARVLSALDRLEQELGGNDYLVGGRFTVADLTAAALFYPLVLPPEGPSLPPPSPRLERLRAPLADRPGFRWVEEIFRRHRERSTPPVAA